MKTGSTARGFGWVVALGGLVACIVLLGHRPPNRTAAPVVRNAHPLLPIDVVPHAQSATLAAAKSSPDPAPDQAVLPHRRRGNFVNNTPRRRELGWAGLLEGPDDALGTPIQQQQPDDSTTTDDPDDLESQARAALNFVGADPEAGALWARAINDADLSAESREQLIEDLDVAGLPAPQRLTQEHLPLILARLAIVEQLAPEALDEANAAAFTAVHGRLANLAAAIERAATATPDPDATPAPGATPAPDAAPAPDATPAPPPDVDPGESPS